MWKYHQSIEDFSIADSYKTCGAVYGGAKMCLEKGLHPGQLKDEVTSPGGTTIAGVHSLEMSGLRATMMNAVQAAANRADELSKL